MTTTIINTTSSSAVSVRMTTEGTAEVEVEQKNLFGGVRQATAFLTRGELVALRDAINAELGEESEGPETVMAIDLEKGDEFMSADGERVRVVVNEDYGSETRLVYAYVLDRPRAGNLRFAFNNEQQVVVLNRK